MLCQTSITRRWGLCTRARRTADFCITRRMLQRLGRILNDHCRAIIMYRSWTLGWHNSMFTMDGLFFVETYSSISVNWWRRVAFLIKALEQEKMKNSSTSCFNFRLYSFWFLIRAHKVPCQYSVSSAREKSDLTIRRRENISKRDQTDSR